MVYWSKLHIAIGGGKEGGGQGVEAPLRVISQRNYPSWSGAENCDKGQYTVIERSNTLIEQSKPSCS